MSKRSYPDKALDSTARRLHLDPLLVGVAFIVAGINHFRQPRFYLAIMPPYVPWHQAMVDLSGYAEIGLGVLALVPRWRRRAGQGLILLLIAIFPANLHMALHADRYAASPAWLLWLRLPLQGVLIALVRRATNTQEDMLADTD